MTIFGDTNLTSTTYKKHISFIKEIFNDQAFIPLHEPKFSGNEKRYLEDCIDTSYVSSVGKYVDKFEDIVSEFTNSKFAIATVNGTSALHLALEIAGVVEGDEVITQAMTFVGTCNAISYCGAKPIFIDISKETLGLSASALEEFLSKNTKKVNGECINKISGSKISAIVPMHTFGHPVEISAIIEISKLYGIPVIEDAAEALGSYYKKQHVGTFGDIGILSFNGNKIVTTGGGGMILCKDPALAVKAKHLSTTAKVKHDYLFLHDEIGYNYRMPNINAAIGCAQMENISTTLNEHKELAVKYEDYFSGTNVTLIKQPTNSESNYWLNTILMESEAERDLFLNEANKLGVMLRPPWTLMNKLDIYKDCLHDNLENTVLLSKTLINLPSSLREIDR